MRQIEHNTQTAFVKWFRLTYPNYLVFAIPNGGARNAITGAMLKAEGATKGIPDIMVAVPRGSKHGLFIEFKSPTGVVRAEQREIHAHLACFGYQVEVCRSIDDAMQVVKTYFAQ